MTDIVTIDPGTSPSIPIIGELDTTQFLQYVKPVFGVPGTRTPVSSTNPLPVEMTGPTSSSVSTETLVPVTNVSGTVLAANSSRKAAWVRNISDSDIYISRSATATLVKPSIVPPGETHIICGKGAAVNYTGIVTAITSTGTKSLEVLEFV